SVTGAVAVRKQLTLSGLTAIVGSSTSPVPSAKVGLGCKYYTNALHTPCSSADNIWAASYDTNVPFYTAPTVAWSTWYTNASPGPAHPCTTSSGAVPVFENETTGATPNNSVPTSFSLTPGRC